MANRLFKQFQMTLEAGVVKLYGTVVTSTSGVIASEACKGFTVAKTAGEVGRYTVTLSDYFLGLLAVSVTVVGSTDAVYTSGKGLPHFLRNVAVSTAGKTFDVQFGGAAYADAELEDGAKFIVEITLKNSQAY